MKPKKLVVELRTGQGSAFIGDCSSVEMRTDEGTLLLIPAGNTFMSMIHTSTLTLRHEGDFKTFNLVNATAGLRGRHLTILAEEILPTAPPAQ